MAIFKQVESGINPYAEDYMATKIAYILRPEAILSNYWGGYGFVKGTLQEVTEQFYIVRNYTIKAIIFLSDILSCLLIHIMNTILRLFRHIRLLKRYVKSLRTHSIRLSSPSMKIPIIFTFISL